MKKNEIIAKILKGTSDSNIKFSDLCALLNEIGFRERIKGSHHIFTRNGIQEIINIQPKNSLAKPYQVKQVRVIIVKYKLAGD
jgi:predicted RNA binding protein YcfA (HicA-like mRNA interferase family)